MSIPRIAPYPLPRQLPAQDRVDWRPDPERAVLLVHDLQDYFLDFYDPTQSPVAPMLENVRALRDACDGAGVPVIYTAQPPQQTARQRGLLQDWWGPGVTARPERAGIAADIAPREHDTVLTKWRYSAFASSDLLERMREQGRDQLLICGVYAHIGCMTTALDAFMRDIQPFMLADALADFSAEEHAMALAYVARRCGVALTSGACIDALKASSGLPASLDALRAELARIIELPVEQVGADDNPLHLGLDSIRLMSLLERWSAAGAEIGFVDLAERERVADWWHLLQERREAVK